MNTKKAVTFNIRCVWSEGDGRNAFVHRAGMVYDKILKELPDIIMFQEFTAPHLEFMKRCLPEYEFYGHFRNSDFCGEGVFTAVRKDSLQVVGYDSYWLSPTPHVPGSRFENQSDCPRTCLTLTLRDIQTNKLFKSLNVHLDHISDEARIEGIKLLLGKAAQNFDADKLPIILGGDFNAEPGSKTIEYCNNYDQIKIFDVTDKLEGTFHNYGSCSTKIDYLYVSESIRNATENVYIWDDCNEGIYLSDHYPVCMEFDIDKM